MPRWRFTARRTTHELTIERDDTEDLPVARWPPAAHWEVIREPPPPVHPLDTSRPWPVTEGAPIFQRLLEHPPVTAKWRPHLEFTVAEAANAARDTTALASLPVVPYPALEEDTLAGEFAGAQHMDLS